MREGVIEQRGWDAGTASASGRSPSPPSWDSAELQIPGIIKDGWHCKSSCCARVMPWKKGAAGGNGKEGGNSGSDPKPSLYPASPPEHRPISKPSPKGVTSHPLFPPASQSSTPIQAPSGSGPGTATQALTPA